MFIKKWSVMLLVLALALGMAAPAYAQGDEPAPEPVEEVEVIDEGPVEEAPIGEAEPGDLDWEKALGLVAMLLVLFPVVGGNAGVLLSTIVDILKAIRLVPDKWGGLVFMIFNLMAVIALYWVYGVVPGEAIPAALDTQLGLLVKIIVTAMTLVSSLAVGPLVHNKVLVPLAPQAFSHSARREAATQPGSFQPAR